MKAGAIEAVEAELVRTGRALERGMARWLGLVAEFDRRDGWRRWGARSMSEWLALNCGLVQRTAREHVRVARRLDELSLLRQGFERGELSFSKVRALARAATCEDEQELVDLARTCTASRLERILAARRTAPSAQPATAAEVHDRRRLDWWWQQNGTLHLHGRLGADDGAALVEALETAAEALHEAAPDGFRPPLGARRADALTEIVHSGAPRAQVVLHVDADALACDDAESPAGEICALRDGPALPSTAARRLSCDGDLVLARHRPDGTVDLGRKRRVVSPALRTALDQRDGGCRFPGCTRRHGLHAHHIEHWARGGATDRDNLVLLCRFHHRLVHEGGFTVRRMRCEVVFRRPDGVAVHEVPASRAPPERTIAA